MPGTHRQAANAAIWLENTKGVRCGHPLCFSYLPKSLLSLSRICPRIFPNAVAIEQNVKARAIFERHRNDAVGLVERQRYPDLSGMRPV
jgi:hypothetical protein